MRANRESRRPPMSPDARTLSRHPQFKAALAQERKRLDASFPQTRGVINNIEAASKACLVIGATAELTAAGKGPGERLIFPNSRKQMDATTNLKEYIQGTPGGRRWRQGPLG